jgi:hypothetical protein
VTFSPRTLQAGNARRAGAVHYHFQVFHLAARQMRGVDHARGADDSGAVLIIMEHRNVHQLAQALLDDETVGRLDVFQVDAAEGWAQVAYRGDEFLDVLGVQLQVDGVDVGKALEQHRLAFHHRLGSERAQIAQPQDGGAVGDDGHHVAFGGIFVGQLGIFRDRQYRHRHTWRISQGEVTLGRHWLGGHHFQLARLVAGMKRKGFFVGEGRAGHSGTPAVFWF